MLRMLKYILIAAVLVILFGIVARFSSLNPGMVTINYFYGSLEIQLVWALAGALVAGTVLGWFTSFGIVFRSKRESMRMRRKASLAEKEINNLRAIPLANKH